ncbi:uncharacterized protein LODBEIA_P50020 [Lodderomyces beijingensis]|uniref:Amine oxidase domain-containing protein n=1 Tax=Lodderomyces beijingensis TaxID=1775926 RepID=A0ABP0ZRJ2_9ASCO
MQHKSVIILGGGMSGIKTAIDLYAGGVKDTMILEARSRLGGRVLTMESESFAGARYDIGASWFHDGLRNPLFDKALASGDIEYYYDDGKYRFLSQSDAVVETWKFEAVVSEFQTYSALQYLENPHKPDVSIKEACMEYLDKFKDKLNDHQREYCPGVIRMWAELWLGESWDKLSAKYANTERHLGRNILVKSGYTKVLNNELKELPQSYRDTQIKLDSQVVKIDYSGKHIVVYVKDGSRYSCDYLVVTIPQSILKISDKHDAGCIQWEPELPQPIQKSIEDVNFGSLGKFIMEFDECFWPHDVDRFYALTNKDAQNPTQRVQAWDFPSLLVNYQSVRGVPALVALTQKPLSKYIEEQFAAGKQMQVWHDIYKPLMAQIAGISAETDIPEPKNVYCSHWNEEFFSRGAYGVSFVGTADPLNTIRAFAKGCHGGKIRFAGAETMDNTSSGCVHGAWFSGQREARAILDQISAQNIQGKGKL